MKLGCKFRFYGLWVCDIWYVHYALAVEGEKHDK
jgi:hypothetical protein